MRWLLLLLLTACKDGSDKDTTGDVVDETDVDTDGVVDSSDTETVPDDTDDTDVDIGPDTSEPEDTDVVETDVPDTDDTDVPLTPAEGFGIASGAADLQSPSFNLKVTVGDPVITHARTSPGYRLEIGVGTLWNAGGTP